MKQNKSTDEIYQLEKGSWENSEVSAIIFFTNVNGVSKCSLLIKNWIEQSSVCKWLQTNDKLLLKDI